ncbi:Cytosine/adenosine deaminase [Desulfonatronum zhilinae]|nr:Cytosine/adenosine deaminase [Desulfonatronum zhilinae]
MELLLTNARWLDPDDLTLRDACLRVTPGPDGSLEILDHRPQFSDNQQELDCAGKLVTRSFALGHHHLYSTFARGMPAPPRTPTNFPEILDLVWWRLDKRLDLPMIKASALATALLCAKRGVTFVVDHHASPFALEGSLETIAKAFDAVGLGHLLCYEMSCRDGEAVKEAGLAETEAYLASGRIGQVGLHASFTVDDDLLARAVDLAGKYQTGLHLHVAEDPADQNHCLEQYGKRVVQRLADAEALASPRTLLAHCVHLDAAERELLRRSPVLVAQASESNLNNNVGLGRYDDLGPRVILGTDGMHVDMLRALKAAFIAGQSTESLGFREAYDRLRRTHELIRRVNAPGDGPNNLVILDYDTPTPMTPDNMLGHFLFGLEAVHVHTVIAQGRIVVENRRLVSHDESEILGYAREQAQRLWERLRRA